MAEINSRVIFRFLLGLAVLAAILHTLLWGMYAFLRDQETKADPQISPLARNVSQEPPVPRLQITPAQDLEQIRENEKRLLENYGWVDQKNGIVRIPVKEAMKIALQKNIFGETKP